MKTSATSNKSLSRKTFVISAGRLALALECSTSENSAALQDPIKFGVNFFSHRDTLGISLTYCGKQPLKNLLSPLLNTLPRICR